MPQSIGVIVAWVASGLTAIGAPVAAHAIASTLVLTAISAGLTALASALMPTPKMDPQITQQSIRQPTAPRRRYYGRIV